MVVLFMKDNFNLATVIVSLSRLIFIYVFLQAELGETQIDTSDAFNDIRPPRVIAALRQERKGRKQDGRQSKVNKYVSGHVCWGISLGSYTSS